jgi:CheY-like chemotaxis protein
MINKERLVAIAELNFEGKPAMSTDAQFTHYLKGLDAFIDSFPNQADRMRDAVDEQSYSVLNKLVMNVCSSLTKIYADNMASKYLRKFEALNGPAQKDDEAIESFIENLILAVSSLSVDIQMASHKAKAAASPRPGVSPKLASAPPKRTWGDGRPLILAVDNALMFLNTLQRLLQDAPYEVHCTTSCAEALQFIQGRRPDCFLLDIEMPEMNGYELAGKIRAAGHNAPIIFVTANSAREYVDKAAHAGAAGMLMKPLRINQLLAKLKENL